MRCSRVFAPASSLSTSVSAPSLVSRRTTAATRSALHSSRTPPPLMAQSEETTSAEKDTSQAEETAKFSQSDLKTYKIPEGKFLQLTAMAVGSLVRGGSGLFVDGYSLGFAKEEDKTEDKYLPFKPLGITSIKESNSKIAKYKRPEKPIEFYEFEACPFCRKVREACTILDLDTLVFPTPRGAPHHRPKAQELGGKLSFPFMVDPNTGQSMYESDDIVAYLFKEYGDGNVPLMLRLGALTTFGLGIGSLVRGGRGSGYRKAKYPEKPLVMWGYELSPFTKFVREVLVELELPFLQIHCARGSDKRQQMVDKLGVFQAPYLEDPNTGVSMFESVKIVDYLEKTYAL